MTDMTLQEALAQIRAEEPTDMPWRSGVFGGVDRRCAEAIATILNAVASGDLISRADAELAVAEAIRLAAEEAAAEGWPERKMLGTSEREEGAMDCANRIETAILALAPADALAEVQRLRAERDAALARVEKLHHLITEASDPDFIWGALDNVHDAETTLDDYAAAVSRAIRAALAGGRGDG